jgi:sugar lactone lactonase YvrE
VTLLTRPIVPTRVSGGLKIRAHRLNAARFEGYYDEMEHRWNYKDFFTEQNRDWKRSWNSLDCLRADDERNVVWCGLSSFVGDIFYVFDRETKQFESLNFAAVGDRYDAKFHRALEFDRDGNLWAATALLHDIDRFLDAPGGAIVRCDPDTRHIEIVSRPIPHVYIQSIAIDRERRLMYGQTFTPEYAFVFDLVSHEFTNLGVIGSGFAMGQSEALAIDRSGTVWGTWSVTRAWINTPGNDQFRLWNYHPDRGRIEFLEHGLPTLSGRGGFAHADGVHAGPDGAIYMGTAEGLLCRIDPDDHEVTVIGKPGPHRRLAGMANGPDGMLYGTAGRDGAVILFRYDPAHNKLEDLGPIFDPVLQERAFQIHDMTIAADGTIYAGENDVPHRSGYLWEIAQPAAVVQ